MLALPSGTTAARQARELVRSRRHSRGVEVNVRPSFLVFPGDPGHGASCSGRALLLNVLSSEKSVVVREQTRGRTRISSRHDGRSSSHERYRRRRRTRIVGFPFGRSWGRLGRWLDREGGCVAVRAQVDAAAAFTRPGPRDASLAPSGASRRDAAFRARLSAAGGRRRKERLDGAETAGCRRKPTRLSSLRAGTPRNPIVFVVERGK